MTELATANTVVHVADDTAATPGLRADLRLLGYWISLGATAGAIGGFAVGGLGGRLAMFALRVTSPDYVRGVKTDDGFVMGQFDLSSTMTLLFITTVMGSIVGLIAVAGRPFFPSRWMPVAWAGAGAVTGGALLIHTDGVDFNLLEPTWLAVALFIAIPCAGAAFIVVLVELFRPWWWRRWVWTAVAAPAAIPAIVIVPIPLITAVVAAVWLVVMRVPPLRAINAWRSARATAAGVFVLVVAGGAVDLAQDVSELL